MRPCIHELENGIPGKQIATITGKSNFKKSVMKRYFEEMGSPVCLSLEAGGPYYEVIPFVYLKGENKGKNRVVYARLGQKPELSHDNIPF